MAPQSEMVHGSPAHIDVPEMLLLAPSFPNPIGRN